MTHVGTPIIIADKRTSVGQTVNRGLLIPEGAEAEARRLTEKAAQKSPGGWTTQVLSTARSIVESGAECKSVVLLNGKVEAESQVRIADTAWPLGTHAFALLGPAPDRQSFRWMSFGVGDGAPEGQAVIGAENETLQQIRLFDREHWLTVGQTYLKGTTLVVTDLPAGADTRRAPDFVVADGAPYRMPRMKPQEPEPDVFRF